MDGRFWNKWILIATCRWEIRKIEDQIKKKKFRQNFSVRRIEPTSRWSADQNVTDCATWHFLNRKVKAMVRQGLYDCDMTRFAFPDKKNENEIIGDVNVQTQKRKKRRRRREDIRSIRVREKRELK